MSVAAENKRFFNQYDPALVAELEGVAPASVEPARREGFTLKVEGKYVHSKYNPLKEAQSVLSKVKTPPQKLHIHFGFGLGYFLQADVPQQDGQILFFEPNPSLVAAAMEHMPLGDLVKTRKARIFCSLRRFRETLRQAMQRDVPIRIVMSPYHQNNLTEMTAEFVESLKRERNRQGMMGETRTRDMFRLFLESTLRSLKHTTQLPGVELLRDKFAGKPGVVAVAGPSLEKNLMELEPFQDNALIFSVSRAAQLLNKAGIDPNFLIQTESKDYFFLIEGCDNLDQTTFLLADQCHERYFSYPCKHKFTYQNPGNMVSGWLNDHYPKMKKQFLATAGSVATEAFSLALVLGCDPIILIGQDLAITPQRFYARSMVNKRRPYLEQDKRRARGYFGGMVDTLANYLHFIAWYEDAVDVYKERYPGRRFINATEGGARIKGFENMKLRDVIWQFCREPVDPEPVLASAVRKASGKGLPKRDLESLFQKSLKTVKGAINLCGKFPAFKATFTKALAEASPQNAGVISKHLKTMDQYNQAFLDLYSQLKILTGFRDQELQPLTSGKVGSGNLEDLARELAQDLERMSSNLQTTEKAARRLKEIFGDLV